MPIGDSCPTYINNCDIAKLSTEQFIRLMIVDDGNGCPALKVVTANDILVGVPGFQIYTDLDGAEKEFNADPGNLLGWDIINPNTYPVYVKFMSGEDIVLTLMVPANGSVYQEPNCVQQSFDESMKVKVTKLLPDADATAVDIPLYINIKYK